MIMLIACSMFRSVSVTFSMGRICRKAEVGLMALGSSTAGQQFAGHRVGHGARQEADGFLAGDGKVHEHHALAGFFLGHHAVDQLTHRRIDLGDHGQPIQCGLEEFEGLAADHQAEVTRPTT
jgi:hypothetical protein